MSEKDFLTGIYNRGKFDLELNRWIETAKRYSDDLAVIMFDLDDLKKINDQYGHLVGDAVLKELLQNLPPCFPMATITKQLNRRPSSQKPGVPILS